MKIEQYISQLLYRYQCVTVTRIWCVFNRIPIRTTGCKFAFVLSSKKSDFFNPFIKNNDGLLANHLAQTEKIPYEIAVNAIQNEVAHWKNKLQDLGYFSIANIGNFSLNSDKNLVFVPLDQINYLKESFGLSTLVSPAVKREEYKEIVEELEEKAPIAFTPEKRNSNNLSKIRSHFSSFFRLNKRYRV